MKLAAGKKARAENKGSTEFEMELVHYLNEVMEEENDQSHVFRSSKTPVDVWMFENNMNEYRLGSIVHCYQCKTTRDTKPPRINRKEFDDFMEFCSKINARPYWVDRWKKNKGQYIRRVRAIDREGEFETIDEDFSCHIVNQTE